MSDNASAPHSDDQNIPQGAVAPGGNADSLDAARASDLANMPESSEIPLDPRDSEAVVSVSMDATPEEGF